MYMYKKKDYYNIRFNVPDKKKIDNFNKNAMSSI